MRDIRLFYCLILLSIFRQASNSETDSGIVAENLRVLTHYSITSANDFPARDPRDWQLLGSTNNGKDWELLDSRSNQVFVERFETKHFSITNSLPCNAYRLEVVAVRDSKNANSTQISQIELKGIYNGEEMADLRPRRTDLVTVQGEYAPSETRRMVFDNDLQSKWLDFSVASNGQRSTWIEWHYDTPSDVDPDPVQIMTRVADLNAKARNWPREPFRLEIPATILWQSDDRKHLVLNDNSGTALVRLEEALDPHQPGTQILLSGTASLLRERGAILLRTPPAVNNDGWHQAQEAKGTVRLKAGRIPITLEWFNGGGGAVLEVEYEGPGLERQKIPGTALWRRKTVQPGCQE